MQKLILRSLITKMNSKFGNLKRSMLYSGDFSSIKKTKIKTLNAVWVA